MSQTRVEATRIVSAEPAAVFAVLCDPQGHVAIDASGMLQDAEGDPVTAAGDSFVVHMDRESLGDYPELGRYDVTVTVRDLEPDRHLSWTIIGQVRPPIGHVFGYRLTPHAGGGTEVTSYCDWSEIHPDWVEADIFPVITEAALRATLGILDRTARRGYVRAASGGKAAQRRE